MRKSKKKARKNKKTQQAKSKRATNLAPSKRTYASVDYKDITQDSIVNLLRDINEGRVDPKELTANARRACLMVVANGKRSIPDLASIFKVNVRTIKSDLAKIRSECGSKIREWGINNVLGQLSINAERFMSLALKQDDVGLAWTIQRDYAKLLRDFGVGQEESKKDDSFKITIESVGQGYERATEMLYSQFTLDPELTGEVVQKPKPSALPLEKKFPNQPTKEPGVEININK